MIERFYHLLPAIYRITDAENDEALRGLMAVLESEYLRLEDDIAHLYRNWFIETCEEWAVPYIADLFGLKGAGSSGNASMRPFVGNTLAYRRRKGTAAAVEEATAALLGRPTRVQEFFQLLAHTQHLNHQRPRRIGTCLIRDPDVTRLVDSAFDVSMHVVDVRQPGRGRGRHNLPNLGVSVWRLQSYAIQRGDAGLVAPGCHTFDPFGRQSGDFAPFSADPLLQDIPLFNRQRTQLDAYQPALESEVPAPLQRLPIERELDGIAGRLGDTDNAYFGRQPVFEIFIGPDRLTPEELDVADLSVWRHPQSPIKGIVDPVLGRLTTGADNTEKVRVSYCYGSPGDIGGGPYFRRDGADDNDWQRLLVGLGNYDTIGDAVRARSRTPNAKVRIIIESNETFEPSDKLILPTGNGCFEVTAETGHRPCIVGDIVANSRAVILRGLWIRGRVIVGPKAESVILTDCTLLPTTEPSLEVKVASDRLAIVIERCSVGRCRISSRALSLSLRETIVHGMQALAIADAKGDSGPPLTIDRCTIFGGISAEMIELSESIVTGKVTSERTQRGCARFSWLPLDSIAPRRYRCQPDMEIDRRLKLKEIPSWEAGKERATLDTTPRFQSTKPGNPAYAQLGLGCPCEVRYGAEDEGEMGAWHGLQEQARFRNLEAAIGEYVRFGLEAGVIERT